MFPAHAGMNQSAFLARLSGAGVPRPRGDEPLKGQGNVYIYGCSPPTRG